MAAGADDAGDAEMLGGLNEDQRVAVRAPCDAPLRIIAGAGTGKTETLARRVAWLVRVHGVPPAQVLVLTFSNKAAREVGRAGRLIAQRRYLTARPCVSLRFASVSRGRIFSGRRARGMSTRARFTASRSRCCARTRARPDSATRRSRFWATRNSSGS